MLYCSVINKIIVLSSIKKFSIALKRDRTAASLKMFEIWLLSVIFVIFYFYKKNRGMNSSENKFPGPRALPILGNSLDFATNSRGIFMKLEEFSQKYERFFRVWNNGKLFLICYDQQDAEVFLTSNKALMKTDLYKFFEPWIGNGLVSSSDIPTWRKHRKIITPTFHFKILQDFLDVFNRNAEILCKKLMTKVGKEPFDVCKFIKLAALDNICETAMGVNVNAQKNSESEYVKAVQQITEIVSLRCFKVWLMVDFFFKLSSYSKVQKRCLEILHGTTNRVIRERRLKIGEFNPKNMGDPEESYSGRRKLAFLDLLLQSEEGFKLSDKELREEVDTFMFAGQDTISSAMSFTLYCLATEQDIQEKVYKEQLELFGNYDRLPTFAQIQEMKYLERVLKETLRLYPSAPIIGRGISDDIPLPGNYKIPKGSQIILNIWALHRNPKVWPDPLKFNPDNFLPDAIQSRHPYSYIPFSAGSRNCIGQKYAMLALKATISLIVRKFRILPSPYPEHKISPAFEVVLLSTNGCNLIFEERK